MTNFNQLRLLANNMDADAVVECIDAPCIDDLCENNIDSAVHWLDEQLECGNFSDAVLSQISALLDRLVA